MSLFNFFKSRGAAPVARERLQILLSHERVALGPRDLVAILRDELLADHRAPHRIRSGEAVGEDGPHRLLLDAGDRRRNPADKIPAGASRGVPEARASAA